MPIHVDNFISDRFLVKMSVGPFLIKIYETKKQISVLESVTKTQKIGKFIYSVVKF